MYIFELIILKYIAVLKRYWLLRLYRYRVNKQIALDVGERAMVLVTRLVIKSYD